MEFLGLGDALALLGMGIMVGGSGYGSAIGLSSCGCAVIGLLKKRPEAFGSGLVLAAIPATQGLYGFVGFILCSDLVNKVPAGGNISIFNGSIVFGAGIAMALVCYGSALWQSKILANGIAGIASGKNVFGQTMILAAFPEFYAILSLVTAILMLAFAK